MSATISRRRAAADVESQNVLPGLRRGYYLVVQKTGERVWLAVTQYGASSALSAALRKHCEDDDVSWWIDYSYGPDVNGAPAWSNLDHTDNIVL